jgi:outer membrane protein assembly factor BamD (BamD/ComL family)
MKWLLILVLAVLMGGSWMYFSNKGKEVDALRDEITKIEEKGDPDGVLAKKRTEADSLDNEKTFSGILLTFVSAGFVGIFFVLYILPFFAQRVTHAVYDSAEMIERDVMHDARSLLAQGDYEGAIAAFKQAAAADPLNRLPWVEIAKIYKDNIGDPNAAIATIRHALESQAWEVNDAAYFLFRLAELYDEIEGDRAAAIAIMNQVVEQFPGTRHSANANHKLHEWSLQAESAAAAAEEQEYLERMAAAEQAGGVQEGENPQAYDELPPPEHHEPGRPA